MRTLFLTLIDNSEYRKTLNRMLTNTYLLLMGGAGSSLGIDMGTVYPMTRISRRTYPAISLITPADCELCPEDNKNEFRSYYAAQLYFVPQYNFSRKESPKCLVKSWGEVVSPVHNVCQTRKAEADRIFISRRSSAPAAEKGAPKFALRNPIKLPAPDGSSPKRELIADKPKYLSSALCARAASRCGLTEKQVRTFIKKAMTILFGQQNNFSCVRRSEWHSAINQGERRKNKFKFSALLKSIIDHICSLPSADLMEILRCKAMLDSVFRSKKTVCLLS